MNATLARHRIENGWPDLIPASFPRDELVRMLLQDAAEEVERAEEITNAERDKTEGDECDALQCRYDLLRERGEALADLVEALPEFAACDAASLPEPLTSWAEASGDTRDLAASTLERLRAELANVRGRLDWQTQRNEQMQHELDKLLRSRKTA